MRCSLPIILLLLLAIPLHGQLTFIIEKIPGGTPAADTLFISGSLNNWAVANERFVFQPQKNGSYLMTVNDPITLPIEYKITRGSWGKVETDQFGHFIENRRFEGGADTVYLEVLSWDDLPVTPRYGWLTIQVESLPENTPKDAAIYAVGSFNSWHTDETAYQLQANQDGIYQVKIPLLSDTTFYKFCRGSWGTIEGRRNGRARVNRQYILGEDKGRFQFVKVASWEDLAWNPINPYTFLLLLAAFQGLLLILAINTLQNNNRAANRILSILLLMLSFALIGRVVTYDRGIFNQWPHLLLLPDFIYFLYAPFFLRYVNRLLRMPSLKSDPFPWWQLIPFLIQLGFYLPLLFVEKETFIAKVVDLELKPFFAWAGGLALIFNAVFWLICVRTVRLYEREAGEKHAFESNLAFLKVVIWLKLACLLIWLMTYLIGITGLTMGISVEFITDNTTDLLWIVFSLTTYFLGYYTMRQPEIFKLPPTDEEPSAQVLKDQAKANSMDNDELVGIKQKLEKVMKEAEPYRNPGLNLKELAGMMDTNAHALSRVINEGYNMNFNDFVNSYRIKSFKEIALDEKNKNYTLVALAFMVGFNSKSAFNRSFKKLENCTPGEFLKQSNQNLSQF